MKKYFLVVITLFMSINAHAIQSCSILNVTQEVTSLTDFTPILKNCKLLQNNIDCGGGYTCALFQCKSSTDQPYLSPNNQVECWYQT